MSNTEVGKYLIAEALIYREGETPISERVLIQRVKTEDVDTVMILALDREDELKIIVDAKAFIAIADENNFENVQITPETH